MRVQEGKFILFDTGEFASWLDTASCTRVIRLIQNHHTWQPSYINFRQTNHFDLLRGMEGAHLERGFSEIAQNLTTFPDGTVAVCRSFDTVPAGIKGANKNGICIENLGNFDAGNDAMTREHRDCILKVNSLLCKKFSLVPEANSIVYHHWYDLITGQRTDGGGATKTCPGTQFFSGNLVSDAADSFIPLIKQELTPGPLVSSGPQIQALYTSDVTVDVLNVRALPSAVATMVKQLSRGTEVYVYEERDAWCRIDPVNSFWVDGHFLASSPFPLKVLALYAAQVTATLLNVRTVPSLSGSIARQLNLGASVYVYEERDGWCRIDSLNSQWVNGNYLGRAYAAKA